MFSTYAPPYRYVFIHLHNFLVIFIDGIEADVLAILAIFFAQLLITPELLNFLLQVLGITALKQFARLADLNQFRDATNVRTSTGVPYIWDSITENGQFSYHSEG